MIMKWGNLSFLENGKEDAKRILAYFIGPSSITVLLVDPKICSKNMLENKALTRKGWKRNSQISAIIFKITSLST